MKLRVVTKKLFQKGDIMGSWDKELNEIRLLVKDLDRGDRTI